ncbi:hypothetical protein Dimus_034324 [Dionaea muscipula]
MWTCFLGFSLLILLSPVLTSGFKIESTVCGEDHLAYSNFHGYQVFYINGRRVDEDSFCKALILHYRSHCSVKSYFGNTSCVFDLSTATLPFEPSRKLLLNRDKESALSPQDAPENHKYTLSSPVVGMAIPGLVILGCVFLCPCFQSRRKESEETVLRNELTLIDSASSFDTNTNPEKVQPTPFHNAPPSPFRHTPPSPFRHAPPSPFRHAPPSPFRHSPPSPFRHGPPSPFRYAASKLATLGTIHLSYDDIAKGTQNFSESLIIGEDGYAIVYKCRLQDGREVAVKRAKKEHFDSAEFDREVEILSKIDHLNLVKLLGYVDKGRERIIITEYVPNGTLRQHLDGECGRILDFNQRLEIAIGVAHGLTYLHLYGEKQIIHRDVKSSNIFLTESLRAKVSDFGFAKVGSENGDDNDKTHISTKVKGTVGYLDPEYMRTHQLTPKSDVYSFGILLLEILTGRRPVESKRSADERVLLRWVSKPHVSFSPSHRSLNIEHALAMQHGVCILSLLCCVVCVCVCVCAGVS